MSSLLFFFFFFLFSIKLKVIDIGRRCTVKHNNIGKNLTVFDHVASQSGSFSAVPRATFFVSQHSRLSAIHTEQNTTTAQWPRKWLLCLRWQI